jgi:hypothetical protein
MNQPLNTNRDPMQPGINTTNEFGELSVPGNPQINTSDASGANRSKSPHQQEAGASLQPKPTHQRTKTLDPHGAKASHAKKKRA